MKIMSGHGPVIALQALQVRLGQWPSFMCMEHLRAVHMATDIVKEVTGCKNRPKF